jgi:hypothetical protein
MVIEGFDFTPWNNASLKIMSIHINEGVQVINGVSFNTHKTLSFGFFLRTITNSSPTNDYQLYTPYTPFLDWSGDWYFGVNYRIRCEQTGLVCRKNVDYADLIAGDFISKGWILIPHYSNRPKDRGVDFFKLIPEGLFAEYQPHLYDGTPIFDNEIFTILPQPIRDWIFTIIKEAKGLI